MSALASLPQGKWQLWKLRLLYFFVYAGYAFIWPFTPIFVRERGLSGTGIGIVFTCGAIAAMLAAPIWARLSGSGDRQRRVLQLICLLNAVAFIWFGRQQTLPSLVLTYVVTCLTGAGLTTIMDMMTVRILEKISGAGFGSVRSWGSFGWACLALAAGAIIERTSVEIIFTAYAIGMAASILLLASLQVPPTIGTEQSSVERTPLAKPLEFIMRPAITWVALTLAVTWLAMNGLQNFESIYIKQLGGGETLVGLASTMGAVIELFAMPWADRMNRRIGSRKLLETWLWVRAASMLVVIIYPSTTSILISRAITGFAFSFFTVGIIGYISGNTLPHQTATALALLTTTLKALVDSAASPLNGLIFDTLGAYWFYVFMLAACLLGWLFVRAAGRDKIRKPDLESEVI